jgi:uncharacterized protein YwgA
MNRQQILLALALSEGGVPLRVGQFDERLVIQKSVCLLQYVGVHLGYRFRWYLRGPYSSDLTSDAFWLAGHQGEVSEELKGWRLDDESRERIHKLKGLFTSTSLAQLAKNLELLASMLFIVRTGQAKPDDYARISDLLKINDKPFSAADVSKAMETLRSYGITP